MVALIGAGFFAIALLFQLIGFAGVAFITVATLTTAGFICVALHLGGVGSGSDRGVGARGGRRSYRRRRD